MIIVSQDKDCIVNFDTIVSIGIEDFSNSSPWQRITAETLGAAVVLGDYKTEERAKEVLQEIISKYKTTLYNSKTNETVVNVPKVFEMPKE